MALEVKETGHSDVFHFIFYYFRYVLYIYLTF